MRLIADGVVERDGVGGVAMRLGYSERHLNRLVTDEVGAGPLAIARAQRAQTSRILIETTDLSLTDVAFAAGFGSVRQFNDTVRAVFDATPTSLRSGARTRRGSPVIPAGSEHAPVTVSLRLATRAPFAASHLLDFLTRRAIPGVEAIVHDGEAPGETSGATADTEYESTIGADRESTGRTTRTYRRLLTLPAGRGAVSLRAMDDHVAVALRIAEWADLSTAVQRIRRMFDLDADPVAVDEHLSRDPMLATFVASIPECVPPAVSTRSKHWCGRSSANRSRWPERGLWPSGS